MENTYYIPTIEEFHSGFEYEQFWDWIEQNEGIATWEKSIVKPTDNLASISLYLDKNELRVKHLDKEDVESVLIPLCFNVFESIIPNPHFFKDDISYIKYSHFGNKATIIEFCPKLMFINVFEGNAIGEIKSHLDLFRRINHLKIKNKSELKRLMVQLGIK